MGLKRAVVLLTRAAVVLCCHLTAYLSMLPHHNHGRAVVHACMLLLCRWDTAALGDMLVEAGEGGHLELAQWLHQHGAPWPAAWWHEQPAALAGGDLVLCWRLSVLTWAVPLAPQGLGQWSSAVCTRLRKAGFADVVDW